MKTVSPLLDGMSCNDALVKAEAMQALPMTSMDARILVLEIALAELVAGLPATRVQSVTHILELLADLSGDVQALACGPTAESLGHLRGWSHTLRDRILTSRSGLNA